MASISNVPRGATYGVIGPSGAGKTTCIRLIMSILFPDSGEMAVLGRQGRLQRASFVAAIINQPDLLILDEPFSGLDPVSVPILKDVVSEEHRRGAMILFFTHLMAHAEELCQHVVMIHPGGKVLDEPC